MYSLIKRFFDILASCIGLIIVSPIILITALLLWFKQGSFLFTQDRPGKSNKIFKLYKFKTMNDKRGHDGELLPDSERLTNIGKWVRKSSFDELPQLFNVLKGDMSLIGPRPLLIEYLPLYNKKHSTRHKVRPGITGWAQVNGRNAMSWKDKFDHDVWYVENQSFVLDLRIFAKTAINVFAMKDISSDTSATMEKFTGKL